MSNINNLHLESKGKVFSNAKELRNRMTETEARLWDALRNRRLNGIKFRRQHPIGNFIADFYCHEARLIIEVDGEIHNDESMKGYDDGRTYELKEFDITVIRFSNQEILNSLDMVLHLINLKVQQLILMHE
jgi:very-short-patch-repair endonuclease